MSLASPVADDHCQDGDQISPRWRLLALETAGVGTSVALGADGKILTASLEPNGSQDRSLLGLIAKLLSEAGLAAKDIDAIAFDRGPGRFIGLRVGLAAAQGWALARDLPLVPVSSLVALAQEGWRRFGGSRLVAALDAGRGQVYSCRCQLGGEGVMEAISPEELTTVEQIETSPEEGRVGNGWGDAAAAKWPLLPLASPSAGAVLELGYAGFAAGSTIPLEEAEPLYLRPAAAAPKP